MKDQLSSETEFMKVGLKKFVKSHQANCSNESISSEFLSFGTTVRSKQAVEGKRLHSVSQYSQYFSSNESARVPCTTAKALLFLTYFIVYLDKYIQKGKEYSNSEQMSCCIYNMLSISMHIIIKLLNLSSIIPKSP